MGELYDQSQVALAATTAAGVLLAAVLSQVSTPERLAAWLAALLAVNVARYRLVRRFHDARAEDRLDERWRRRFLAGVAVSGAVWGSTLLVLVPPEEAVYLGFAAGPGGVQRSRMRNSSANLPSHSPFVANDAAPYSRV